VIADEEFHNEGMNADALRKFESLNPIADSSATDPQ
jgi:hypothetical protein